jgi:predicted GTPase
MRFKNMRDTLDPESGDMRIGFLGKTGAGKTSLVNALFGLNFRTGNYRATTMAPQRAAVTLTGDGHGVPARILDIIDTPGLAESIETEPTYRRLYAELLPELDHVVWVVSAHPRTFRVDQEALIALRPAFHQGITTTVALTRADTIGPNDWDVAGNCPSPGQRDSLEQQVANLVAKFAPYLESLRAHDIVPCAAPLGYGLNHLIDRIRAAVPARDRT